MGCEPVARQTPGTGASTKALSGKGRILEYGRVVCQGTYQIGTTTHKFTVSGEKAVRLVQLRTPIVDHPIMLETATGDCLEITLVPIPFNPLFGDSKVRLAEFEIKLMPDSAANAR